MLHDWFMYHLRSTYKNRLDFPFNLFYNTLECTRGRMPISIFVRKEEFCPFVSGIISGEKIWNGLQSPWMRYFSEVSRKKIELMI